MKRKSKSFRSTIIRNGLIPLGVAYLLFFLVPLLRFIPFVVLAAGLVLGLWALLGRREYASVMDRLLHFPDDGTLTFTRKGDKYTLQGFEASSYLEWDLADTARTTFGHAILAIIYLLVGLITAPLEGILFWVGLVIVVLSILGLLLIVIQIGNYEVKGEPLPK